MSSLYYQRKPVPEGFESLLHDMIKEILRAQPENVEEFCYNYFDKLIRKQSKCSERKTENASDKFQGVKDMQDRFRKPGSVGSNSYLCSVGVIVWSVKEMWAHRTLWPFLKLKIEINHLF